ncbi:MAG: N-6 DNA methylase [Eubacteriales bacterium]|nr:N-6 DNA methylase [Eubacteriales bacterium]
MSSIISNEKNKEKCQKFTPEEVVTSMLDLAGYTHNLFEKRILEYSFGSGNILKAVVKRYIEDALSSSIPLKKISEGLARDIHGIELDKELFLACVNELNEITNRYQVPLVRWSLLCEDTLHWKTEDKFDFIIGNPPYISYHDIDDKNRAFIRKKFKSCNRGKFDYCYAFLEKGLGLLAHAGKMVQLVPSNIYKNVFADKLRELLLPGINTIWEYPENQLFGSTLTSSSIFLLENGNTSETICYKNVTTGVKKMIKKTALGGKWAFDTQNKKGAHLVRFGDRFCASIAIATLYNEAFIISGKCENIEQTCLRKAAAPRSLRYDKSEFILFPYSYDEDGKLIRYEEDEFKHLYPNAYNHLLTFKTYLSNRDADKTAKWFEYGRSQALSHINQEKLLMSTVITNAVELYRLSKDDVPYSGIYITTKNNNSSLDEAEKILHSPEFFQYIMNLGISISGKSKRITCKDINDYQFEEE